MIVAERRPLESLAAALAGRRRVAVLGCGGCVTVCRAGGETEALDLARELSHPRWFPAGAPELLAQTIERQCEADLVRAYLRLPEGVDAVLSLACGVGVQVVGDVFDPLPVIPALSTTFYGGSDEPGVWREYCRGCGDCMLDRTAALCPVARCSKHLHNGPCGGSHEGKCEVAADVECVWDKIVKRLAARGQLDCYSVLEPPRDWRSGGAGGPRRRERKGLEPAPGR